MGTYSASKTKNPTQAVDCSTYFDAAYFLLHNTFADNDGYGMSLPEYQTMYLVKKTEGGQTFYTFNSGYDNTVYDTENHVIYNSQTSTMSSFQWSRGNKLPYERFDPAHSLGYSMDGDPYVSKYNGAPATNDAQYYNNTNYNLTLEGHAQFIYYEDNNLYFDFTGDDDVYLYINGVRVLDIGGSHAISRARINLNDVAEICGLSDGAAYDFDFYYMERHGTAANFGIVTNIKIVDPAMTTAKEGYQNGISTGYGGFVDPALPVEYEFELENDGETPITNLTFTDSGLGVILTKSAITLNSETSIDDLSVTLYNADSTLKTSLPKGSVTADELKTILESGLAVGERIVIRGLQHQITDAEWTAGSNTFTNTVVTTANSVGNNGSTKTLNGIADWKVQKSTSNRFDLHLYEWVGHGVSLTKSEILNQAATAIPGFGTSGTVEQCSASGSTSGINTNAKVGLSGSTFTYTGTETGADSFYVKATSGSNSAIIRVIVYSYDVANNQYVLDYNLPVELNGTEFGVTVNDTVYLKENPNTTADVSAFTADSAVYGDFALTPGASGENSSLTYTMKKFMSGADSATVTVRVLENGASTLTKFTGVEMTEQVVVVPANVVYYEDDFVDITYVTSGGETTGLPT